MKLLVAILTCHRLDYYFDDLTVDWLMSQRCLDQQARVNTQRTTWLRELPEGVDYKFFYGSVLRQSNERRTKPVQPQLREPLTDEVFLPCGDNYTQNSHKLKEICRWAIAHGYEYILRVDDDTFVYPDRLLKSDWVGHDYSGPGTELHPGGCLFLSRHAMEIIVKNPVTNYADDIWIAGLLKDSGVKAHQIPTIWNKFGSEYKVIPARIPVEDYSAFHSCTPDVMKELYARRVQSDTGESM